MRFDELITDVARDMTDVVPSPHLRARVMAGLRRPQARRRPVLAAAGAAAATVAIVTATILMQGPETVPALPAVPPAAFARIPANSAGVASTPVSRPRAVKEVQRISADEAAWLARSVQPLAGPEAIEIDSIQPSTSAIAPISVEAVGLKAIDVPPIDVRAGGGR